MIPYFPPQSWQIGPLPIHLFGILVAIGILIGSEITVRRANKIGLDREIASNLVLVIILSGFAGAHFAAIFFYHFDLFLANPWRLIQFWNGISSLGGFLGAFIGIYFYCRIKKIELWSYMDLIAYALPFGWTFGRMGCSSVHDHPGIKSDFFLAVKFPGGARHDLGFYEFLFTLVVTIFFISQRNKQRKTGFYLLTLILLYAPFRFAIDFLRIEDTTFLGLTFAQYAVAGLFFIALWQTKKRLLS